MRALAQAEAGGQAEVIQQQGQPECCLGSGYILGGGRAWPELKGESLLKSGKGQGTLPHLCSSPRKSFLMHRSQSNPPRTYS